MLTPERSELAIPHRRETRCRHVYRTGSSGLGVHVSLAFCSGASTHCPSNVSQALPCGARRHGRTAHLLASLSAAFLAFLSAAVLGISRQMHMHPAFRPSLSTAASKAFSPAPGHVNCMAFSVIEAVRWVEMAEAQARAPKVAATGSARAWPSAELSLTWHAEGQASDSSGGGVVLYQHLVASRG